MIEHILKRPWRSPGREGGRRDRPSVEPPARLPVPSADRATLVRAAGITKTFTRGGAATNVLCGVDLRVRRGESLFLAGPSGSGKTTLLSIVGAILSADGGRLEVAGEDVRRMDERSRARLRQTAIGFVFQRFHLIRGLSALENVAVPLTLTGAAAATARRRAAALLEAVGLGEKSHAEIGALSVGQCQRVAVARALALDPPLILADEPTASLDAESGQAVIRLLGSLAHAEGRGVVVVTHDARIFPYGDRICHLDGGRIVRTTYPQRDGTEGGATPTRKQAEQAMARIPAPARVLEEERLLDGNPCVSRLG